MVKNQLQRSILVLAVLLFGATLVGDAQAQQVVSGTTGDSGVTITAGNSIASYDTAGTTVTGGTYLFNIGLGPSGSQFVDLTPYDLFVAPTEILTVSGFGVANANISASINWAEDI